MDSLNLVDQLLQHLTAMKLKETCPSTVNASELLCNVIISLNQNYLLCLLNIKTTPYLLFRPLLLGDNSKKQSWTHTVAQINSALICHHFTSGEVAGLEEEGEERKRGMVVAPWSSWEEAVLGQTAEPLKAAAPLLLEEEPGQTEPVIG